MLGIIGGMGPQAGNNLFDCILKHTKATKDQDHLPVVLWSTPDRITDRSEFLINQTAENPAIAVAQIAQQMHQLGILVIGVPCNTFHSHAIWQVLLQSLKTNAVTDLELINMIEETANALALSYPENKVGILGTLGTYQFNVYTDALAEKQIGFVLPEQSKQAKVHQSVYDCDFGIKTTGKITNESLEIIHETINNLIEQGTDLILLGCTEFSLIPTHLLPKNVLFIDPVEVLAKAMIKAYLDIKCTILHLQHLNIF